MTKFERITRERRQAVLFFEQGRAAEGRLKYEKLLDELMPREPKRKLK